MILLPYDGDKIVLISPDGIEYPGTIEKRDMPDCYNDLHAMCFKINSRLEHPDLWPGWEIKLEKEDRSFRDFGAFLTTDRSVEVVLCRGCDIAAFIQMAVNYGEFFKKLRADFIKKGRHQSRTDHLRQRLDIYIDICDRIEREFSRL